MIGWNKQLFLCQVTSLQHRSMHTREIYHEGKRNANVHAVTNLIPLISLCKVYYSTFRFLFTLSVADSQMSFQQIINPTESEKMFLEV